MKTILVVDDEKDDLESMYQILENAGYAVLTANDGTQALETLGKHNVDVILLDIMMPTLSGYDLLRILHEKIYHKIPVVFVSIQPEKEVDTTQVDGFVQKPFAPSTLVQTINEVIANFKQTMGWKTK